MSHIFISYSHTDSDYAHRLAKSLEYQGFLVWIDDRVDYGTQWPRIIQENLDNCAAFVVIMTPRSYVSDWVQSELNRAKRKNKPMFPILLEGDEPWLSVETTQYVEVGNGELPPARFYDNIGQIVPRLDAITSSSEPSTEFTLPMLEWCAIPAGNVLIEGKSYEVPAFQITRYPVTNQQFAAFVESSDGWMNPTWWGFSQFARKWHDEECTLPPEATFIGKERPRENVSWFDAVAFSRWLGYKTQSAINLPSEQQWQRAAQGDGGRAYPWGNTFDKNRCNTWESRINETTPVHRYTDSASPYDVVDMAGNVWEWCLTEYTKPSSTSILTTSAKTLRGGSWGTPRDEARTTYRFSALPNAGSLLIGLRLTRPDKQNP